MFALSRYHGKHEFCQKACKKAQQKQNQGKQKAFNGELKSTPSPGFKIFESFLRGFVENVYFFFSMGKKHAQGIHSLTLKSANNQNSRKIPHFICKTLKNKWYHAKVLLKRFHMNGHIIGFRQQTKKLELHYMSP